MKLLACVGLLAAALLRSLLHATAPAQGASDNVAICHVPPANPSNVHSIAVGAASVAKHLREHGDFYDLEGTWSGPFSQPPFQPYPIVVEFRDTCSPPGSVIASVGYPTFACSGTWTLESAAGTTFVVEESLTAFLGIPNCRYALTFDPVAGQINLVGLVSCPFNPETWTAVLTRTP